MHNTMMQLSTLCQGCVQVWSNLWACTERA